MIKNYLSHFLPVLLALDLIIPFLLAPFYKDYNHLTQVMSVLGNSKAPLHSIYNIWLVAFGVAILISTLQLYPTVAQVSSSISIMLFSVIVIYAVGGCILSGIFSVGETKSLETLSAKIHGYGSVIGFLLLTLAPLFVGLYFFKVSNGLLGILSLICFTALSARLTCPKPNSRPIRHNAQVPDRNGKIFYTSITSLSHINKIPGFILHWRTKSAEI